MKENTRKMDTEIARRRSTIEMIELSLGRFCGNLSDDRKVRLFKIDNEVLKKLARDVADTQTGIKATSLIVAAIADSEKDRPVMVPPPKPQPLSARMKQPASARTKVVQNSGLRTSVAAKSSVGAKSSVVAKVSIASKGQGRGRIPRRPK